MKQETTKFIFETLWRQVDDACICINEDTYTMTPFQYYRDLVSSCKDILRCYKPKNSGQFRYELSYLEYLLKEKGIIK